MRGSTRKNAAETYEGALCKKCKTTARLKTSGKCVECRRATGRKSWAKKLPSRLRHWTVALLNRARKGSKLRGHPPPSITREWIEEQLETHPNCYYTGVPLVPPSHDEHAGQRCPWAPSLDRIDNAKGYTPENVRITSWLWNNLRGDLPVEVAFDHLHQMARCIVFGRTPKYVKNPAA